ncbi:MAG: peptidoglycan-binding protein [Gammaproteobacteria bacterium]|nr:peptidoglycan-binding protein [Gammaproteobacteria bacterium]
MNKSAQHSAAQQELIRLGYNPGNADGVWGATSHKALLAYQADHRLPTTGRLSPVLFALLTAQR